MATATQDGPIRAAGAIILRGKGQRREVCVIHRPAPNLDWSLPKGKVEDGEALAVTAVREVDEETGLAIRLGQPLGEIAYQVGARDKFVSFWLGVELAKRKRSPDHEVDDVAWVPYAQALQDLTYADEAALLTHALKQPATTPLIILRHAQAVPRKQWGKDDTKRPLDEHGKAQSRDLAQLLRAYGIRALSSSTSTRCRSTLQPYSRHSGVDIKPVSLLSEEVGEVNLKGVQRFTAKLREKVGEQGVPTVVCGHRPVLPAMLAGIGLEYDSMAPGSCVVAHIDMDGRVAATEWHEPPEALAEAG